ncbi:gluconate 2-dehydrogenase subunit 3 family protein [Halovenus halobia]|uniref:gluconate 2-dehydrogenase subunit 3 family protein n=1 Tax=Halovenus halobia TaxID=3396622 RepID=UPI003F5497C8
MELTRRDAVAALAALGGAGGATYGYSRLRDDSDDPESTPPSDDHVRETMIATAEIVYPSELSGIDVFVEEFIDARLAEDDDHAAGIREAVAILDEHSLTWHDQPFADLSADPREEALDGLGADVADENPDGSTAERVRYYVVNELLLALYSSPTGGTLVGIENPQGHPGGIQSYQRGPNGLD